MFFAYVVLRPSAGSLLEGPDRLTLWSGVFQRFFPWVWVAIVILLSTGNVMIFSVFGGMQQAGLHIHVMNGIGWIMFLLFLYLNTVPSEVCELLSQTAIGLQGRVIWPLSGTLLPSISVWA